MATSKKLTGDESYDLTSFAADIHASLSAQQANDEAQTTQDTYGHGSEKPLASYDRDTQSWKMHGDTSLWGEQQSLANLPPSGMTQNGVLYPQPAWVGCTNARASSSWPTPRYSMWKNQKWWRRPSGHHYYNLEEYGAHVYPHLTGRYMNPEWIEWLMGFPTGWTELEA